MMDNNYTYIERAVKYQLDNFGRRLPSDELAAQAGLGPERFREVCKSWACAAPEDIFSNIMPETLRLRGDRRYAGQEIIINTMPSTGGRGIDITYGVADSPFGECFIAVADMGICALFFTDGNPDAALNDLRKAWKSAALSRNDTTAEEMAGKIFRPGGSREPLNILLNGTPFQVKIWRTLLKVPFGNVVSYGELAEMAGDKKATRAVASAVGKNLISYIIPCHRIIRSEGVIGKYRWRPERKAAMIAWEKAKLNYK